MERVIQMLVECDKKARDLVQQAKQQRQEELDHLSDHKYAIAAQYNKKATSRLEMMRSQMEQEKTEQITQVKKQCDAQLAQLKETYEANKDRWVDEIVRRCIDG